MMEEKTITEGKNTSPATKAIMGNRNKLKKNLTAILLIAAVLTAELLSVPTLSGPAAASESKIPRKWGPFELEANLKDLKQELTFFNCLAPNAQTRECRLMGYPQRDDFIVLKFYQEKLAAMAEFRAGVDLEKTLSSLKDQLGDPTMPNYQSDEAVAYIWENSRTFVTLTHLIKSGFIVYEIRDRVMEPLYRKSVEASKQK